MSAMISMSMCKIEKLVNETKALLRANIHKLLIKIF